MMTPFPPAIRPLSASSFFMILPLMILPSSSSSSDISYDSAPDRLQLVGFPEESPATPATLLAADRHHGWNQVTYDATTDTYAIDAALWIGNDTSLGTFFQIGDREHPDVTVVVKGTVWDRPPQESPRRSDGRYSIINRLTLGDRQNDSIRATLKIDCETRGQHGLYVGYRSHDSKIWIQRGALHVYNSTITAARQGHEHVWGCRDYLAEGSSPRWASPGWYASDLQVVNATVSWFEGCVAYGCATGERKRGEPVGSIRPRALHAIRNTTFEHGGTAVQNGTQYLTGCVFRNMQNAVAEGGCLSAKLVDCVFEDNQANWTLGSAMSGGIVMLDCIVGPQRSPLFLRRNRISPENAIRRKIPVYPTCVERQSLVVKVTDDSGETIPQAMVIASCPTDPGQVASGATSTGDDGLTPDDPEQGAVVLTAVEHRATDDPNSPKTTTFDYNVSAKADGFRDGKVRFPAGTAFERPLLLVVDRKAPPPSTPPPSAPRRELGAHVVAVPIAIALLICSLWLWRARHGKP